MTRTRDGLLDGALSTIEREGLRRFTMAAVCTRSGVAKATLYNHFRTKPDVLLALVSREVDRTAAAALAGDGTAADALDRAAAYLGGIGAARRVARDDPGALVPLLAPGDGPGWSHARQQVAAVLGVGGGDPVVGLVLAWLGQVLLVPLAPQERLATASALAALVRPATPESGPPQDVELTAGRSGTST
jgi:AcrR family transcriptional regulator